MPWNFGERSMEMGNDVTVGNLKAIIKDLPEDMRVAIPGYEGEIDVFGWIGICRVEPFEGTRWIFGSHSICEDGEEGEETMLVLGLDRGRS